MSARRRRPSRLGRIAHGGLLLALLAGLAALVSGLGYRMGFWHFTTGFAILRWAGWTGLAAVALSILGGVFALRDASRGRAASAFLGVVLGFTVAGFPYAQFQIARRVPKIHDITTDTLDPPPFIALLALRRGARNPAAYDGAAVAALQKRAYPDIGPARFARPAEEVFDRALEAAIGLGWNVASADRQNGRIEATDTTFWFGFTDDVVVRLREEDGKTRVDVRSKSRIGRSDVGANARRIRSFLALLREKIPGG